jgi:hypothetical protein
VVDRISLLAEDGGKLSSREFLTALLFKERSGLPHGTRPVDEEELAASLVLHQMRNQRRALADPRLK